MPQKTIPWSDLSSADRDAILREGHSHVTETSCCGLGEVSNLSTLIQDPCFFHTSTSWARVSGVPAADRMRTILEARLSQVVDDEDDYDEDDEFDLHQFGALFATTIAEQTKEVEMLRATGWTEVTSFKNPNTGNMITLWVIKRGGQ